jgi:hypothetical protein
MVKAMEGISSKIREALMIRVDAVARMVMAQAKKRKTSLIKTMDPKAIDGWLSSSIIELDINGDGSDGSRPFLIGGEHVNGYLVIRSGSGHEYKELVKQLVREESLVARLESLAVELDHVIDRGGNSSTICTSNHVSSQEWRTMRSVDSLTSSPFLLSTSSIQSSYPGSSDVLYEDVVLKMEKDASRNLDSRARCISSTVQEHGTVRIPVQFVVDSDVSFVRATAVLAFSISIKIPPLKDPRKLGIGNSMGEKLLRSIFSRGQLIDEIGQFQSFSKYSTFHCV